MPSASAAPAERRRNAVSLATSAICHALIFGLGALLLTRTERPAGPENVEVALVEAKPDPIRVVAPTPPARQPAPTAPVPPITSVARPRPKSPTRVQNTAPQLAVSPSTEVATTSEVALPTAPEPPPPKNEVVPSSGLQRAPPAPAPSTHGSITVLAAPRYRSNPRPEYPVACRRRHEEGEVRVAVAVGPDGRPLRVSLAKSSGHPLLDQAAIDAVRGWTFEPARTSELAVTSEVVVPVRFSLSQE
jgi:protein TonB